MDFYPALTLPNNNNYSLIFYERYDYIAISTVVSGDIGCVYSFGYNSVRIDI